MEIIFAPSNAIKTQKLASLVLGEVPANSVKKAKTSENPDLGTFSEISAHFLQKS